MAKLVSLIGATGIQGGSVIRALLGDDAYVVRAITRSKESAAAKALRDEGADVVEANLNDISSLQNASLAQAVELESQYGINLARAAIATTTLEHYVWSTLPDAGRISNGKAFIPHFAAKNEVDNYIRSSEVLLKKTTFFWATFYASNLQYPFYKPIPVTTASPRKYIQLLATPPSVPLTLIGDARINVGLFVRPILNQPRKTLPGRAVLGATDEMTAGELLSLWASIHRKEAEYVQVNKETYYRMWL